MVNYLLEVAGTNLEQHGTKEISLLKKQVYTYKEQEVEYLEKIELLERRNAALERQAKTFDQSDQQPSQIKRFAIFQSSSSSSDEESSSSDKEETPTEAKPLDRSSDVDLKEDSVERQANSFQSNQQPSATKHLEKQVCTHNDQDSGVELVHQVEGSSSHILEVGEIMVNRS